MVYPADYRFDPAELRRLRSLPGQQDRRRWETYYHSWDTALTPYLIEYLTNPSTPDGHRARNTFVERFSHKANTFLRRLPVSKALRPWQYNIPSSDTATDMIQDALTSLSYTLRQVTQNLSAGLNPQTDTTKPWTRVINAGYDPAVFGLMAQISKDYGKQPTSYTFDEQRGVLNINYGDSYGFHSVPLTEHPYQGPSHQNLRALEADRYTQRFAAPDLKWVAEAFVDPKDFTVDGQPYIAK